jgi:negative regulator of replication initiation
MSALIPFTLERTIKPFQQRYADQLSEIIRKCADIKGDVHFKEINWEDEKTAAEIEKIKAETVKLLAEANKAKADDAKVKKETRLLTSDSVNKRSQNVEDTNVRNTKTSKSNKKN